MFLHTQRIIIVTDAWHPQVNGVVRTYEHTVRELRAMGCTVHLVTPSGGRTVPCPTYPDIRLALKPHAKVAREIESFGPDAVHVATEGPLGHAARYYCLKRGIPFTTAYHTQFPEYLRARAPIPQALSYRYLRRWHGAAAATMVSTPSVRDRLRLRGFERLEMWPRGVNTSVFRPLEPADRPRLHGAAPRLLYMGRVAVEKNLEAFLELDVPGSKFVVGDGPELARLRARYPAAHFLGPRQGRDLACHVASADAFVFPSRTDTFGLVLLEAMACGVPVAAYPVTGPLDVVEDGISGALDDELGAAVHRALKLDPAACVRAASRHTWRHATECFVDHLAMVGRRSEGLPVTTSTNMQHTFVINR